MKKKLIDHALEEVKALGVRNILALRGDPPREEEYRLQEEEGTEDEEESNEHFVWAIDLVKYIRRTHGDYFCIGVAAYPEGHADESHPVDQDPKHDLPYLVEKMKAGADFVMTQLFYDEHAYISFERMLREHESGVFATIPIIPGLMPIQNYQILKRTTKLSHCKLPQQFLEKLEDVRGNDEAVKRVGVDILSEMVENIKKVKSKGPRGFHFYTLNLEKAVGFLLEKCDLIPFDQSLDPNDSLAIDDFALPNGTETNSPATNGVSSPIPMTSRHRVDSTASQDQLTTSTSLKTSSASPPSRATTLAISHGLTPAGREATWDDYPNGRFGDPRSPAFGTPLTYSPTSLPVPPHVARALWGEPASPADITALFVSHLAGNPPHQLPWSESASLSPETALIQPQLHTLNSERNWWTIASQPAVDGIPSADPTHGWGPPGGFIFQKAFVEFFCSASDFQTHLLPYLRSEPVAPQVSFYAGNAAGDFVSSEHPGAVHAVTWGSFPGKEIVTATMVEEVSFRAWVEEAFGRWAEWGRVVRSDESRKFLRRWRGEGWLVNVIGHGYRKGEEGSLWDILMGVGGGEGEGDGDGDGVGVLVE